MNYRKLTRRERLAAEFFGYSLANYADHLDVENVQFTEMMPRLMDLLERACKENWTDHKFAKELDVPADQAASMLEDFREARTIVDAPNASETFRFSVRKQLRSAFDDRLDDSSLDDLVTRICYCAADLGSLLEWEGTELVDYSEWLRREKGADYTGIGLPNLDERADDEEPNVLEFPSQEEDGEEDEEADLVRALFESLPDDAKSELKDLLAKAETAEDFVAFTMIGPCPRCGNELTKDGMSEADDELDGDPTIGICPDCGHQWCVECGQPVQDGVECPHWTAWVAYCEENDIDPDDDPELDNLEDHLYLKWLEDYVAGLQRDRE